jgi:hypothetical protein
MGRLVRPVDRAARELTRHAQVPSDIRAATTSRAGYPGRQPSDVTSGMARAAA